MKRSGAAALASLLVASAAAAVAWGQNVVRDVPAARTAEPVSVTLQEVRRLIDATPQPPPRAAASEADRVRGKLDRHVAEFLDGHPWMAFHNTLGISGYEAYFDHPDEVFSALSLALPHLTPETAARVRRFLGDLLAGSPPYAVEGFERTRGRPRERYRVPQEVRIDGRGRARDAFGVYAFWLYCWTAPAADAARERWPAVLARVQRLVERPYDFDPRRTDYRDDEAERLNGNLAGLLGFVRLAELNGEAGAVERGTARLRELLELRVNLERVNPTALAPTRSATHTLHNVKAPRYLRLVPEVAAAVADLSDGLATERVGGLRGDRPSWHLAFGDRLTGGENYHSPPHVSRALMAGAALVERLPSKRLCAFVDVPWCAGDLYFIEKCAYALRAGSAAGAGATRPGPADPPNNRHAASR